MSRSSILTYPPSAPRRQQARWAFLDRKERTAQLPVFATLGRLATTTTPNVGRNATGTGLA